MRAWVLHRTGDPREVLGLEEVPTPDVGAGELVVDIEMAGIVFPDLLLVRGEYQISLPLPSTPGAELIGRVSAVGPGTSTPLGARVMATTTSGRGSFAQQAVVQEAHSQVLPENISVTSAIALPTNYVTAHLALHRRGNLRPGEVVVILGGAGGVGGAAIDLACAAGARVIAVDVGAERAARCEEMGADLGIDAAAADLREQVMTFSNGKGADVVLDLVGGDLFEAARRFVAFEGRIIICGFVSGSIPQVKVNQLILRSFGVLGVNAMVTLFDHPQVHEESRRAVVDMLDRGAIRPAVDGVRPFEAVPDVLAALGEQRLTGKWAIAVGATP